MSRTITVAHGHKLEDWQIQAIKQAVPDAVFAVDAGICDPVPAEGVTTHYGLDAGVPSDGVEAWTPERRAAAWKGWSERIDRATYDLLTKDHRVKFTGTSASTVPHVDAEAWARKLDQDEDAPLTAFDKMAHDRLRMAGTARTGRRGSKK